MDIKVVRAYSERMCLVDSPERYAVFIVSTYHESARSTSKLCTKRFSAVANSEFL